MKHRLYAALAPALALALLIATASFVGTSQHLLGLSSPWTSATPTVPDDGRGDVAVVVTRHTLLVGLFVALALFALGVAPSSRADASEERLARGPPLR